MKKESGLKPNRIALTSLIVGLTVLLFGNNIIGRINCGSNKKVTGKLDADNIRQSIKFDLKNVNIKELHSQGWRILSENKKYLDKGLRNNNGLELYTLVGDFWIENSGNMQRFVDNTFVLPITQGDFTSEVLVIGPVGDCKYQQAGIVLLTDTVNLANNFRYTIMMYPSKDSIRLQCVQNAALPEKNNWDQYLNATLIDTIRRPKLVDFDLGISKSDSIWLVMSKYKSHYILQFKIGSSDRPANLFFAQKIEFQANFICLTAFQGQISQKYDEKINCNIVPVVFSNFHVIPIHVSEKGKFENIIKKNLQ